MRTNEITVCQFDAFFVFFFISVKESIEKVITLLLDLGGFALGNHFLYVQLRIPSHKAKSAMQQERNGKDATAYLEFIKRELDATQEFGEVVCPFGGEELDCNVR